MQRSRVRALEQAVGFQYLRQVRIQPRDMGHPRRKVESYEDSLFHMALQSLLTARISSVVS